jgi:ribosomal protein S18 acetylase RimI-like enzyme
MSELRAASPEDFAAVYEFLDTQSRRLFGISELTIDHLRRRWQLPGREGWVALADGRIAGYASLDAAQEVELVAPEPAAGDALVACLAERGRERGFGSLAATVAPEDTSLSTLLRRSGFAHDHTILRMWRTFDGDPPAAAWPEGVAVRPYEPADATTVKGLLDAAYSGWDRHYVARPLDGWIRFMTDHDEFDPAMWFLVERDGQLVACALHWREHQRRGWVKDLAVDERERGRGLGKALLHHGFAAYAERGVDRVGLKVDASNPTGAPALYERVGFVTDRRDEHWLKPL